MKNELLELISGYDTVLWFEIFDIDGTTPLDLTKYKVRFYLSEYSYHSKYVLIKDSVGHSGCRIEDGVERRRNLFDILFGLRRCIKNRVSVALTHKDTDKLVGKYVGQIELIDESGATIFPPPGLIFMNIKPINRPT